MRRLEMRMECEFLGKHRLTLLLVRTSTRMDVQTLVQESSDSTRPGERASFVHSH